MAEDIDFKYPMRKACAWEISTFCQNVPHGHARVIRCLQKNMDNEDMSRWGVGGGLNGAAGGLKLVKDRTLVSTSVLS
jgi:hypothetical protein